MNSGVDWMETAGGRFALLRRLGLVRLSMLAFAGLAVASWTFILAGRDSGFGDLFTGSTWAGVRGFLGELAGEGAPGTPAFLDAGAWADAGVLASETLAMSILAITFAASGVILTVLPAARNVAMGELAPAGRGSVLWRGLYFVVRGVFVLTLDDVDTGEVAAMTPWVVCGQARENPWCPSAKDTAVLPSDEDE